MYSQIIFSRLYFRILQFLVYVRWDLFVNEVADKSAVHPVEFIKIGFNTRHIPPGTHRLTLFAAAKENSNHIQHASSNFISSIKIREGKWDFRSEIGFLPFSFVAEIA